MATDTSWFVDLDARDHTPTLARWWALGSVLQLPQAAVGVAKVGVALGLLARPPGPTAAVIVLLTVAVYGLNDLTDGAEDGVNDPRAARTVREYGRPLRIAAAGAGVGALAVAATGGAGPLALALLPVAVGVAYSARVLPGPGPARLKDVAVLNTVATAGAWAVPVALLPVAFAGATPGPTAWFACAFLFVRTYVASEFANVPDAPGDAAAGVATLPVVVGPVRTRWALVGVDALSAAGVAAAVGVGVVAPLAGVALLSGVALSAAVVAPSADGRPAAPLRADLQFPVTAAVLWLVTAV